MLMCDAFDSFKLTFTREAALNSCTSQYTRRRLPADVEGTPFVTVLLESWMNVHIAAVSPVQARLGSFHHVLAPRTSTDDFRRDLPLCFTTWMRQTAHVDGAVFYRKRVKVAWINCYLNDVKPDTSLPGWEAFEHSHRCVAGGCFHPAHHGCWESKSKNQSRGYGLCSRPCVHCMGDLCECQVIHYPKCL